MEEEHGLIAFGKGIDELLHMVLVQIALRIDQMGGLGLKDIPVKNHKLSFSQVVEAFTYHNLADPALKTSLVPIGTQFVEDLDKSKDHHILGKMQIPDVLPAEPEHLGGIVPVECLLGAPIPFKGLFDQFL